MKKTGAFTILEMIVSITLFAFIVVIAFDSLGSISISRLRSTSNLDVYQDMYYAAENIANTIKNF